MQKVSLALAALLTLLVATTASGATGGSTGESRLAWNAIPIGNGLYLGGFSDLFPTSSSANTFLAITDRGPNSDIPCRMGFTDKRFPLPNFTPEILRLVAGGRNLNVVKRIPMTFDGEPISGRSVRMDNKNEQPYGPPGCSDPLSFDPNGIDSEAIVEDPRDGSYWVGEEYLPSVVHVSKKGELLGRVIPFGNLSMAPGPKPPLTQAFPAIVGSHFRPNRGFEGAAISPDGRWLYTLLQSAMQNPTGTSTNFSRAIRVFKIDISNAASPVVVREWVYRLDGTSTQSANRDRRISALVWAGVDKLIVEERDDMTPATAYTTLYLADFMNATNILGTQWDLTATSPTLEQNFLLPTATTYGPGNSCDPIGGVVPGCKYVWFNVAAALAAQGLVNGKLEGVGVVQKGHKNAFDPTADSLVAVINDNDFNVDSAAGTEIDEKLDVFDN